MTADAYAKPERQACQVSRPEPIVAMLRPEEATRSPDRPCRWVAETTVEGRAFVAQSRYGTIGALCRQLVEAGVPDAPLQIMSTLNPARVALRYRSFHHEARFTVREGAAFPIGRVRWVDPTEKFGRLDSGKRAKGGVKVSPATEVAPEAQPA